MNNRRTDPSLFRTLRYFRSDLPSITLSLLVIAVARLCELLQVYPLAILADQVFGGLPAGDRVTRAMLAVTPRDKLGQIVTLAVWLLVLRAGQELLGLILTRLNVRIGYAGLVRVRSELFRHLQTLGLDFHHARPQGETLYRLAYDTAGVQTVLNAVVQGIVVSSITLAIMLGLLLSKNVPLTLLSLAVVPPLWWTSRVLGRRLGAAADHAKRHEAELTAVMQQSIDNISLTQSFSAEAAEFERFTAAADRSVRSYIKLHNHEMLLWLCVGVIFGFGGALMFGVGGYLVYRDQFVSHRGESGMTLGKLWIFMTYLSMLYAPLKSLSGSGAAMAGGLAGARRVFAVLDEVPTVRDEPGATALPRQPRLLSFGHVNFAYTPGCDVLRDISFTIAAGEAVAIVGPSGAGKSTLLSLVNRCHDPTAGVVCFDGIDLRSIKLADVRAHVAVVAQETILLPGTIRQNIAYARPSASDAEVREAAERAGATFIDSLPLGFDHVLGEGGINLSGGQRQRIGIARAILSGSPILIMDEPTSALDAASEATLVQTLAALKGLRTVIVVSHRASTVAGCDRMIELPGGRLVDREQIGADSPSLASS